MEEAGFRASLAYAVLLGHVPLQTEKRPWLRSRECPVLVDVCDWTTDRRIFSLMVWPPLESDAHNASYDHLERVDQVKRAFGDVCVELAWSTRFETDWGLRWDRRRECWVDSSGFHYDGSRLRRAA